MNLLICQCYRNAEKRKDMKDRFQTFTVLIAKMNRCIRKIKSEELAEFDLKSPHVSCLYYLYGAESLTATELCEICEEDKAAISRSIDYLESRGFLVSHSKTQKRYKCPLELTDKGREIARRVREKIDGILYAAGGELSEEDRANMYRCMLVVAGNLEKLCEQYED